MAKYIHISNPMIESLFLLLMIPLVYISPLPLFFKIILILFLAVVGISILMSKKPEENTNGTSIKVIDINSKEETIKATTLKVIIICACFIILAGILSYLKIVSSSHFMLIFRLILIVLFLLGAYAGLIKKEVSVAGHGHNFILYGKKAVLLGIFYLSIALFILATFFVKMQTLQIPTLNS
jgi:hypothetical protein